MTSMTTTAGVTEAEVKVAAETAAETEIKTETPPKVTRHFRLQWEPAQDAWVLLYPEGMVKLSQSAGEILRRCDGVRHVSAIVSELEGAFNAPDLAQEVRAFLEMARKQRWIEG